MPVIKIGGGLNGGNDGSSKNSVNYLEKENKVRDKSKRSKEQFFDQIFNDVPGSLAIKMLDSKRRGIPKKAAKFFNLIISPSQKELAELSNEDLKEYTREVMVKYAENFDKGIDPSDLIWFAKLEKDRKYKGFKKKDKEKLPPGIKSGDYKPGDNRHIHILVRRKTEKNNSISPLASRRKGITKGAVKGAGIGFDRIKFSNTCEDLMVKTIQKRNKNYVLLPEETKASQFLKNNKNDFHKAIKLGYNEELVKTLLDKNVINPPKKIPLELIKDIRRIAGNVIVEEPKDFNDYIRRMGEMGIKIIPSIVKGERLQGYRVKIENYNLKASDVHRSLTLSHMTGKKGIQDSINPKFDSGVMARFYPEINEKASVDKKLKDLLKIDRDKKVREKNPAVIKKPANKPLAKQVSRDPKQPYQGRSTSLENWSTDKLNSFISEFSGPVDYRNILNDLKSTKFNVNGKEENGQAIQATLIDHLKDEKPGTRILIAAINGNKVIATRLTNTAEKAHLTYQISIASKDGKSIIYAKPTYDISIKKITNAPYQALENAIIELDKRQARKQFKGREV